MRLIDADELKIDYGFTWDDITPTHDEMYALIDRQPTIEERKKGEWMDYTEDGYVECPFCHSATNCDGNRDELHFCFSCGADMRGAAHEN